MALNLLEKPRQGIKPQRVESSDEESRYVGYLACSFTLLTAKSSEDLSKQVNPPRDPALSSAAASDFSRIQHRDPCHTMN